MLKSKLSPKRVFLLLIMVMGMVLCFTACGKAGDDEVADDNRSPYDGLELANVADRIPEYAPEDPDYWRLNDNATGINGFRFSDEARILAAQYAETGEVPTDEEFLTVIRRSPATIFVWYDNKPAGHTQTLFELRGLSREDFLNNLSAYDDERDGLYYTERGKELYRDIEEMILAFPDEERRFTITNFLNLINTHTNAANLGGGGDSRFGNLPSSGDVGLINVGLLLEACPEHGEDCEIFKLARTYCLNPVVERPPDEDFPPKEDPPPEDPPGTDPPPTTTTTLKPKSPDPDEHPDGPHGPEPGDVNDPEDDPPTDDKPDVPRPIQPDSPQQPSDPDYDPDWANPDNGPVRPPQPAPAEPEQQAPPGTDAPGREPGQQVRPQNPNRDAENPGNSIPDVNPEAPPQNPETPNVDDDGVLIPVPRPPRR